MRPVKLQFEELYDLIDTSRWFSRVGATSHGHVPLLSVIESANWNWLPTARDQTDPIHCSDLCRDRDAELAAAKGVLKSVRSVADSLDSLVDGPHDYTTAAKGGAQFAARMAAREISNNVPGFWCDVIRLFQRGWWPCGLTEDKQLVVY